MQSRNKKDNTKEQTAARQEFEVAYYTKELGRPLQRKLLQRQLKDFSDHIAAASHGEETASTRDAAPPREDRAG